VAELVSKLCLYVLIHVFDITVQVWSPAFRHRGDLLHSIGGGLSFSITLGLCSKQHCCKDIRPPFSTTTTTSHSGHCEVFPNICIQQGIFDKTLFRLTIMKCLLRSVDVFSISILSKALTTQLYSNSLCQMSFADRGFSTSASWTRLSHHDSI